MLIGIIITKYLRRIVQRLNLLVVEGQRLTPGAEKYGEELGPPPTLLKGQTQGSGDQPPALKAASGFISLVCTLDHYTGCMASVLACQPPDVT